MQISRYENSATPFVPLGLRGLGSVQSAQTKATIESIAASGASTATAILVSMSAVSGPIGIAIGGVIAAGLAIASMFKGCGQTCVQASNIADQVEVQMKQMLQAYMNAPVHYASVQQAYLTQWDAFWQALTQACSDPNLQDAGKRCISDRQRGACVIHDSSGACWDWFKGYRDPVANDPNIVPDPTSITTAQNILSNVTGGSMSPMLLIGLLALGGFVVMSLDERH